MADATEQAAAGTPETAGRPERSFLEQTWDFFASVPIAIVIIFLIAATSVAGSLIEQEGAYSSWQAPAQFYPERYGPVLGSLLYKTGLTRMYTSWWYLTLLFMLGASLVICSIERFVPLWKNVQRPNVAPEGGYIRHLKNRFSFRGAPGQDALASLAQLLRARRYKVVRQGDRLYADRGRWGRWGPYILHIGLIIILLGAMSRAIPGFYFDTAIWVRDGATVKVPNSDWYVKNEQFEAEFLDSGMPKFYKTHAVVIDGGNEVKRGAIAMNEPLSYRWVELYQSSYKQDPGSVKIALTDRQTKQELGTFEVDLFQPDASYVAGGYTIKVREYFPDFGLDDKGKPVSRSSEIKNPGFVLDLTAPNGKQSTIWYFVLYPQMEFDTTTPVRLETQDVTVVSTTGLKVKKDLGIPVIYLGLLITSLGAFLTFYLPHRRFWAMADGESVLVGGWTNRNQTSFQSEIARLATQLDPETNPYSNPMEDGER